MNRRKALWYAAAVAATLLVQVWATTIVVTSLDLRHRHYAAPLPPGRIVDATPALFEYTQGVRPKIGMRVLDRPEAYAEAAALYADSSDTVVGHIRSLALRSHTGHILFHQPVGCDLATGPRLRLDGDRYAMVFSTREERRSCTAPAAALVAFVIPA